MGDPTLARAEGQRLIARMAPWVISILGAAAVPAIRSRTPFGPLLTPTTVAATPSPQSYALAQGVIVEPQRHRFYLTGAREGVEAVDFVRRSVVWVSSEVEAPILVWHDRLLALGRPTQPSVLRLLLLDVGTGTVVDSLPRDWLPFYVVPSVGMQPEEWFGVEGTARGDTAFVTCTWGSRVPPARPPARSSVRPIPTLGPPWQARTWWGFPQRMATIVVDLRSHMLTVRHRVPDQYPVLAGQPGGPYELGPFLVAGDTVVVSKRPAPGGSEIVLQRSGNGKRFRNAVLGTEGVDDVRDIEAEVSADGRHVVLERMMAQREGDGRRFTVYSTDRGRRLGQVDLSELRSAFVVSDGRFVYANGFQAEAQVLDLTTGHVLFRAPVRALRYVPFSGAVPG